MGRGGDDDSGIIGEDYEAQNNYSQDIQQEQPGTVGFDRISIDLYNKSSQGGQKLPAKSKLIVAEDFDNTGLNNLVSNFRFYFE